MWYLAVLIASTLRDTLTGVPANQKSESSCNPNSEASDYHFGGLSVVVIRSELLDLAHSPGARDHIGSQILGRQGSPGAV